MDKQKYEESLRRKKAKASIYLNRLINRDIGDTNAADDIDELELSDISEEDPERPDFDFLASPKLLS